MSNVFELFATLSLDDSRYREGLDDAENRGSRFGSGLRTAGRAAAVAVAGATTAVVGFGASSVRAGMDFDSAMSQVAATMGTTVDQIGDLRDFAQEMGSTTAFSATEAAQALNYMALAGYDAETSMEMLPNVLNLAASGNMDLAAASDMVTDSQTALGLSLEETNVLVDQMARTASTTNTSVSQLGDAILTVGGTAQFMSGGTTELNSVLGVLADNGIKGSEAGTHLRNMILSLSSPTDDARAQLEALGVEIFDAEGNMRDWAEIFPEMSAAMDDMTSEERINALGQIFNTRDVAAATALMSTSVDRWNEVGEAIDNAQGSAQAMAETQLDNLSGDITLFKSALEGAKIAISDQLTPQLRDFVGLATTGLSDVTAAFQEGGLEGAMGAVGRWLSDALTQVVEATPQIVRAGMELLRALGTSLTSNAGLITDSVLEVAQILIDSFTESVNGDGSTGLLDTAMMIIQKLGNFLVQNAPTLITTATTLITDLISYFVAPENQAQLGQMSLDLILAIADGLVQAIPDLVSVIPEIIAANIEALATEVPAVLQFVGDFLGDLAMMVFGLVGGLLGMSYDQVVGAFGAIGSFLRQAFTTIGTTISNAFSTIADWVSDGIAGWVSFFEDGWTNITTGASSALDNVAGLFVSIFDDIRGTVEDAVDFLMGVFDFEWSLPQIQLPHFTVTGGVAPFGLGGEGSMPSIGVQWYARGYQEAMVLDGASIFGAAGGKLLGGGERGPEYVVGEERLKKLIAENAGATIVVPVYIEGDKIDEFVVNSKQRTDYISGGRG